MEKKTVKLPAKLVQEAQTVGLNVSKSCELGLQERIKAVKNGRSIQKINNPNDNETPLSRLNKNPKKIIEEFKDFCRIDLDLANGSIKKYTMGVRDFLKYFDNNISKITKQDVREYLKNRKEEEAKSTYASRIITLRRFLRDFLGAEKLIEGFKLPENKSRKNHKIPDKNTLQKFYNTIEKDKYRAAFLFLASSGLRTSEATNLKMSDVNFEERMITPDHKSTTKRAYVTFYNQETEKVLNEFLPQRKENDETLFQTSSRQLQLAFEKTSDKAKTKIKPKTLRKWFAKEMRKNHVTGSHIDAFCGRAPKSVLARHYTDYSPERLKKIYNKADIKILS